ncbi:MAG: MFS transporter, partial [Streptosporangiales bacterium]|nr:MFS transporter [Streptosporangiales bacterium]
FTETVEKHNPALTATGLAVWGWIIRVVIAVSVFILPFVINSMTPLVTYGTQVATISQKYAPELATLKAVDAGSLAALQANPADTAAATKAIGEIATAFKVSPTVATGRLKATATIPKSDLAYLTAHGPAVESAAAEAPGQWKEWWWVCVAGMVVFLPFILTMAGRWSPRKARQDAEEHERQVQEELKSLAK